MIPLIDDRSAKTVALNIRYLCWKESKDRNRWPALLASWLGQKDATRKSEAMLSDVIEVTADEIGLLVSKLNLDEGEFVYDAMHSIEGVSVLHENLLRLLAKSGGQTKSALAEQLGVSSSTLSRWIKGKQTPDTSARRGIAVLFGLRDLDELEHSPIFLAYLPVNYGEQVAWINSHLHGMTPQELRELFPALQLIFSRTKNAVVRRPRKKQKLLSLPRTADKKMKN